MWIFTKYGMLSAVEHMKDKSLIHVRAREPKVLEMFAKRNGLEVEVEKTPTCDYLYRATFDREAFAEAMKNEIMKIDYTNYKNAAKPASRKCSGEFHHALMNVWWTMCGLQHAMDAKVEVIA